MDGRGNGRLEDASGRKEKRDKKLAPPHLTGRLYAHLYYCKHRAHLYLSLSIPPLSPLSIESISYTFIPFYEK